MKKSMSKNKLLSFVLSLAMVFAVVPSGLTFKTNAASDGFHASGTKVLDANGKEFVMRGTNIAHAWYKNDTKRSIAASQRLGANTARLVFDKTTTEWEMEDLIKYCIEHQVVPVVELHDWTGKTYDGGAQQAAWHWSNFAGMLNKYKKYAIVNIANEWCGEYDGNEWENGYKEALQIMRNAGIHNMIMIDGPGWAQNSDNLISHCSSVFNADPDKNVVFSIHMYGQFGTSDKVRNAIDGVLSKNVPLVIGEFGWTHSDGDVDEWAIMQQCTEKNVGYLAWSWDGNSGGVEYLDLFDDPDGYSMTEWGNTVFNTEYGIKNTSKVCSIFSDNPAPDSSEDDSSYVEPEPPVGNDSKEIWNGNVDLGSDWETSVKIDGNIGEWTSAGIKVGFNASSNAELQLAYEDSNGNWITVCESAKVSGDTYTFNLTPETVKEMSTAKAVYIKGQNVTVNSVTVVGTKINDNLTNENLWNGYNPLGEWDVDKELCINGGIGDWKSAEITVDYKDANNAELQLAYFDKNGEWVEVVNTVKVSGNSYTFSLNNEHLKAMANAQKIYVKGQNATVTSVSITGEKAEHTHNYTGKVTTPATCTEDGVMTYTCECGDSYTEVIKATGHKYVSTIVPPTTTDKGYTLHTCSVCGYKKIDTFTDPVPEQTKLPVQKLVAQKNSELQSIRFMATIKANDLSTANSGYIKVTNVTTGKVIYNKPITAGYNNYVKGGTTVSAPEGSVFLMTSVLKGINNGEKLTVEIFLDNYDLPRTATLTIKY